MATPEQLRAARGLLDWSQTDLAEAAGVSLPTVKRVERDLGLSVSEETRTLLRRALEKAGVVFVEENGEGPGVRLKKLKRKSSAYEPGEQAALARAAAEKHVEKHQAHEKAGSGRGKRKRALTEIPEDLTRSRPRK